MRNPVFCTLIRGLEFDAKLYKLKWKQKKNGSRKRHFRYYARHWRWTAILDTTRLLDTPMPGLPHAQSDGPHHAIAIDDRVDNLNPTGTNVLLTYDNCSAIRSTCVYFDDPTTAAPPPIDAETQAFLDDLGPPERPFPQTDTGGRRDRSRSPGRGRVIDLTAAQRRRKRKSQKNSKRSRRKRRTKK